MSSFQTVLKLSRHPTASLCVRTESPKFHSIRQEGVPFRKVHNSVSRRNREMGKGILPKISLQSHLSDKREGKKKKKVRNLKISQDSHVEL